MRPLRPDGARAVAGEVHPAAAARGEDRTAQVRALFGAIAPRYELVNSIVSAGRDAAWRRRVVAELGLQPGQSCLDACCGTGDLSRALADSGVDVIGVDFCRPMLEQGVAAPAGQARIAYAEGDAMRLPIGSASMDAACVAFGLRNLADPAKGVAELARVVRPGGRVAILEFSQPRLAPIRWLNEVYSSHVLPLVGDLVSGSWGTYRYLPQTIRTWLGPEELADLMRGAGLTDVRVLPMTLGVATIHVGVVREPGGRERG